MVSEKVLITFVSFFIVMSMTTNLGFVIDKHVTELYIATFMNITATFLKALAKKHVIGMTSLATSFAADLHLIAAVFVTLTPGMVVAGKLVLPDAELAIGLASGALAANVVSIALLLMETQREARKEE